MPPLHSRPVPFPRSPRTHLFDHEIDDASGYGSCACCGVRRYRMRIGAVDRREDRDEPHHAGPHTLVRFTSASSSARVTGTS